MNKLIPSIVFAMLTTASSMATAAEQTIKLSVPDMTCISCPYMVKQAISAVDGIKAVLTSIEAIQQATADIGYPSTPVEEKTGS